MGSSCYTYHYHQPDEYRFSLDSVHLAKVVADEFRGHANLSDLRFLDLCSGVGVIGFELYFYLNHIEHLDFIEVQETYIPYFEQNKSMIAPHKDNFKLHLTNYGEKIHDQNFHNKYDVIFCNPPYFFKDEGVLSPSEFKNRCRFFIDSTFQELFHSIGLMLKENAMAYVLVRDGKEHKRNPILEIQKILSGLPFLFEVTEQCPIRGVLLLKIEKKEYSELKAKRNFTRI